MIVDGDLDVRRTPGVGKGDDGAVLIPQALVEAVAKEGTEQERLEGWIMSEVERGVPLPGLYPPNDEAKARYAATKK